MTAVFDPSAAGPCAIMLVADEKGLPPISLAELRPRVDLERTMPPGTQRMRLAGRILPYLTAVLDEVEKTAGSAPVGRPVNTSPGAAGARQRRTCNGPRPRAADQGDLSAPKTSVPDRHDPTGGRPTTTARPTALAMLPQHRRDALLCRHARTLGRDGVDDLRGEQSQGSCKLDWMAPTTFLAARRLAGAWR